jgi:hypothetical protein
MLVMYSRRTARNRNVVVVSVGGNGVPCSGLCDTVLTMDPEIEFPVLAIPFGGVVSAGVQYDDSTARSIISQTTPEYAGGGFYYRCTRILDVLLVKVLVDRTPGDELSHRETCDAKGYSAPEFCSN